jgi:hypothetical protein
MFSTINPWCLSQTQQIPFDRNLFVYNEIKYINSVKIGDIENKIYCAREFPRKRSYLQGWKRFEEGVES